MYKLFILFSYIVSIIYKGLKFIVLTALLPIIIIGLLVKEKASRKKEALSNQSKIKSKEE